MLMRSDPLSEFERLTRTMWGSGGSPWMPMDVHRHGDEYLVTVDLPGVEPTGIDVTVDHGSLTIRAERERNTGDETQILTSERPYGTFRRQVFIGEGLDNDRVEADYVDGVLTVRVPLSERSTARKVEITSGSHTGGEVAANTN